MSQIVAARIDAVAGNPSQRKEAAKRLNGVAQQAKLAEFIYIWLEARLALGELETGTQNSSSGRMHLEALQKEATGQGFQLIAQKAATLLGMAANQAALHLQN